MVKSHPENTVGVWGPSWACEEGHTLPLHYCMLSPPASFRGLGPPQGDFYFLTLCTMGQEWFPPKAYVPQGPWCDLRVSPLSPLAVKP